MSDVEGGRLPEAEDILMARPIYSAYDISQTPDEDIWGLQYFQGTIDAYCVECRADSIFESEVKLPEYPKYGGRPSTLQTAIEFTVRGDPRGDRTFQIRLSCTRDRNHRILFFFLVRNNTLTKVGQCPSAADFELPKVDRFKQVLDDTQLKEFARAVGLYAHGIGIGSFVYLRRIFEFLIEKAHQSARQQENWDDESYRRARMDEKIVLLREFLPTLLVDNAGIYSILSTGIHLLGEDECLDHFPTVRRGIEMILDEELEKLLKERHAKGLKDDIGQITGRVRSSRSHSESL